MWIVASPRTEGLGHSALRVGRETKTVMFSRVHSVLTERQEGQECDILLVMKPAVVIKTGPYSGDSGKSRVVWA